MNTKRIFFWSGFIIVIALIIWGLIVAMNKPPVPAKQAGTPAVVSSSDHVLGSSNAPVTLIEYSDFQCPACEDYYPFVKRLLSEASTTMRLVYRHFPLQQHANAIPSAMASEAAAEQGKFWQMYDELFTNHTDWTELTDATPVFQGYATKIGLDAAKFKADLASSTLQKRIADSLDEGVQIGIDHTPTFFVNGKIIDNPSNYDQFKTIIDQAAQSGTK